MSRIKEPCFFVDCHELKMLAPRIYSLGIWKYIDRYANLFDKSDKNLILGESSTLYTYFPHTSNIPKKIHAFNPDARFVYIIRDPIERTLSHFWHNTRMESRFLNPYDEISNNPVYINTSYYSMQLEQYLKYFTKDRLFVYTFEKLVGQPRTFLTAIFNWLGVNSQVAINNLNQPQNESPKEITVYKSNTLPYWIRASKPALLLEKRLPYIVHIFMDSLFKKRIARYNVSVDRVIEYLRPIQLRQTDILARLLGIEFPEWKTLYDK
jgi:hypothetical protein